MIRAALFAAIWLAIFAAVYASRAEDHAHPPADAAIHEKFYKGWLMPNGGDARYHSCCNLHDCYPTQFKYEGGTWFARRREDGLWMAVPASKLESEQRDPRESPDGRGHVCAPPPAPYRDTYSVYCAVLGAGI